MAVSLRMRAKRPPVDGGPGRGLYRRWGSRGAFNPVPASTSSGATGAWVSRQKTAVYGTVPLIIPDASRDDDIESRVRRNTNRTFWNPTWSVLRPKLVTGIPRPPLPHPVTFAVGTSVGPPGGQAPQPRGRVMRRTGAMNARVTTTPKPTAAYKVQGKKKAKPSPPVKGRPGTGPAHGPANPPHVIPAPHSGSAVGRATTARGNAALGPIAGVPPAPVRPHPAPKRTSRPVPNHVNAPRAVQGRPPRTP